NVFAAEVLDPPAIVPEISTVAGTERLDEVGVGCGQREYGVIFDFVTVGIDIAGNGSNRLALESRFRNAKADTPNSRGGDQLLERYLKIASVTATSPEHAAETAISVHHAG